MTKKLISSGISQDLDQDLSSQLSRDLGHMFFFLIFLDEFLDILFISIINWDGLVTPLVKISLKYKKYIFQ